MPRQNDPTKTIYATMFIVGAVQHVKIGDLSAHQGGVAFTGDSTEDRMDVDEGVDRMPEDLGNENLLDRDEERSLTRDSTSGFAGKFHVKVHEHTLMTEIKTGLYHFSVEYSHYTRTFLRKEANVK